MPNIMNHPSQTIDLQFTRIYFYYIYYMGMDQYLLIPFLVGYSHP